MTNIINYVNKKYVEVKANKAYFEEVNESHYTIASYQVQTKTKVNGQSMCEYKNHCLRQST